MDYVAAEDAAKAAKRGIWAGAFDVPADWRKERKVPAPSHKSLQALILTVDASYTGALCPAIPLV